jgi:hypothetical protein
MRKALRGHARLGFILALTVGFLGFAGAAWAQQTVCIDLDDGLLGSPPLLYRLSVQVVSSLPGFQVATVAGTATQGSATRVVTGAGAVIDGGFELSLQGTDIASPQQAGGSPLLVTHSTHVLLNSPSFQSGTFESVHTRIFQAGQGVTESVSVTDGTATVVACPLL